MTVNLLLLSRYWIKKNLCIYGPLCSPDFSPGDRRVSHCVRVSEQVSGNGTFNLPCCQSALFISPTVAKLFIYLQMYASQELSYIHNFRECIIFEEGIKENDKDDKRAE